MATQVGWAWGTCPPPVGGCTPFRRGKNEKKNQTFLAFKKKKKCPLKNAFFPLDAGEKSSGAATHPIILYTITLVFSTMGCHVLVWGGENFQNQERISLKMVGLECHFREGKNIMDVVSIVMYIECCYHW